MPEQERDEKLGELIDDFVDKGVLWSNQLMIGAKTASTRPVELALAAIHARVAELVAKAREEGRQEALHPPIEIDPDWMRHFATGTITAIGKPDAFDGDPPPIFTPTETGAKP